MDKKKILFSGIIAILIGTISSFIFDSMGYTLYYDLVSNIAYLPNIYIYGYIIILGPIIEEFLFRFAIGKSKIIIFSSLFLISLFLFLSEVSYILIAGLGVFLLLALLKNEKNLLNKKIHLLLTSILFSIAHIANFEGSYIYILSLLVYLFGVGQVLAFFRIKYNIFASVSFHIVYNLVVTSLVFFGSASSIIIDNNSAKVSLTRDSMIDNTLGGLLINEKDGVVRVQKNTILQLLEKYSSFDDYMSTNTLVTYSGSIQQAKNASRKDICNELIKSSNIKVDTIYSLVDGYMVSAINSNGNLANLRNQIVEGREKSRVYIKNKLRFILKQLAKSKNITIKIDERNESFDRIEELYYYLDLSFESNIALINNQVSDKKLVIEPAKIDSRVLLLK